jgi:hypothetical protein
VPGEDGELRGPDETGESPIGLNVASNLGHSTLPGPLRSKGAMKVRTIVFWTHLVTGVAVALVVLLMSVTGVALAYQRQLTELANRDYRSGAWAQGVRPLDVEALLATLRAQDPDFRPSSLTPKPDPAEPAVLGQGRRGRLYVDRYSGQVLGDGSGRTSAFVAGCASPTPARCTASWGRPSPGSFLRAPPSWSGRVTPSAGAGSSEAGGPRPRRDRRARLPAGEGGPTGGHRGRHSGPQSPGPG